MISTNLQIKVNVAGAMYNALDDCFRTAMELVRLANVNRYDGARLACILANRSDVETKYERCRSGDIKCFYRLKPQVIEVDEQT